MRVKQSGFPLNQQPKAWLLLPEHYQHRELINIGGLTYLQWCKTFIKENIRKNFLMGGIWEGLLVAFINATELNLKSQSREHT
jgi:hypothetical protein